MDLAQQYKLLVESLRLLASSYEVQLSSLPDFAVVEDEVVDDFENAFLLLPQLIEGNLLSKTAIASIIRCFNYMDMVCRNESLFNREALKDHESWQKVRELAGKALDAMGEPRGKPDPGFV